VDNSEIWSARDNGVVIAFEQNIILRAGVSKRWPSRQSSQECVECSAFILLTGMSGYIYEIRNAKICQIFNADSTTPAICIYTKWWEEHVDRMGEDGMRSWSCRQNMKGRIRLFCREDLRG